MWLSQVGFRHWWWWWWLLLLLLSLLIPCRLLLLLLLKLLVSLRHQRRNDAFEASDFSFSFCTLLLY